MAGARMITNYPASIIVHGMALNITVQSYDQSLDFGLMADAHAMPDVQDFARAIEIAFDDVRTLPLPEDVAAEQAAAQGGMVQRAARGAARAVSGAVGGAVAGVVRGAVRGAVRQAVQGAVAGAVRGAAKRAVAGARADPSKSTPKSTPAPKPAPARRARGTVKR
jgi:hypothetical protein